MRISDWSSDVCSSDLGPCPTCSAPATTPRSLAGAALSRWRGRSASGPTSSTLAAASHPLTRLSSTSSTSRLAHAYPFLSPGNAAEHSTPHEALLSRHPTTYTTHPHCSPTTLTSPPAAPTQRTLGSAEAHR